ncbi:MAG: 2-iminoacetate synthase ThiH [Porphyromonadaceae bacterium]|nr:2-iminoacetate synthase ThiH [Porphyromonadaceae bacterium]
MSFYDELQKLDWEEVTHSISDKTEADVRRALSADRLGLEDFKALISPAAEPFLREMATKAEQLTLKRYGRTIQMYVPLYLSNHCANFCVYCGFNCLNQINRVKLDVPQIMDEIAVLKDWGYKHILLVSGESPRLTPAAYYEEVVRAVRPHFSQVSLEVQPLQTEEYARLVEAGVSFVCVYQETYHEQAYPKYHPKGLKANFRYRLETPERCAQAGIRKVGIGALLGLEDWRTDAFFTALHLNYLERYHWRTKYSISLPRLRPHVGEFEPKDPINDRQMAQLICAYRLFDPEVDISLSTREGSAFRDMAMHIGVTSMSAGSSTEPGGYAKPRKELEQFEINDARSVSEMAEAIRAQGYEPVWKDWDFWL